MRPIVESERRSRKEDGGGVQGWAIKTITVIQMTLKFRGGARLRSDGFSKLRMHYAFLSTRCGGAHVVTSVKIISLVLFLPGNEFQAEIRGNCSVKNVRLRGYFG